MIDEPLGSKTSKVGAHFRLHLVESILEHGVPVVPEGAAGEGEVIHAAHSNIGGKAGELIIAARFIDYAGVRIPLGHFRWARAGVDKTDLAIVLSAGTGVGFLLSGGEVAVPVGTLGAARTTADVSIPPLTNGDPPR